MTFNAILVGAIVMASMVIALFFLRFWRSTRDRIFLYFSVSFALEATSRIVLVVAVPENEDAPLFYLIRLVAYGLILVAIFEKNRHRSAMKRREKNTASQNSTMEK